MESNSVSARIHSVDKFIQTRDRFSFIPDGLQLTGFKRSQLSFAYSVISSIYQDQRRPGKWDPDVGKRLYSLYMRSMCRDYADVLKRLKEQDILQVVVAPVWSAQQSTGYQLNPRCITSKYHLRQITCPKILKQLARNENEAYQSMGLPQKNLVGWQERFSLEKDCPSDPSVDTFNLHQQMPSVDSYGRFHHAGLNMPRKFRRHIKYKKESLVGVDVGSCQLLLLMLTINKKMGVSITDGKFLRHALEGVIYDLAAKALGMEREAVKEQFFLFIYGPKWRASVMPLGQYIIATYPDMWARRVHFDGVKLAHEMQRLEAAIMIEEVCELMRLSHYDAPLFPLHDAIATLAQYAEVVQAFIEMVFKRRFGVVPSIKIKPFSLEM